MNLPRLEHWFMTEDDLLLGKVYNHPTIPDGEIVRTTRVVDLDLPSGLAITKNSRYILGKHADDKTNE